MPRGRAWTYVEQRKLADLRMSGMESAEIGRVLGRTEAAIRLKCVELGIHKTNYAQEKWLRLLQQQHCVADVAREQKVTYHAVEMAKNRLRKAGFHIPDSTRKYKLTKAQVQEIRDTYKWQSRHANLRILADKYGVNPTTIRNIVTKRYRKVT